MTIVDLNAWLLAVVNGFASWFLTAPIWLSLPALVAILCIPGALIWAWYRFVGSRLYR